MSRQPQFSFYQRSMFYLRKHRRLDGSRYLFTNRRTAYRILHRTHHRLPMNSQLIGFFRDISPDIVLTPFQQFRITLIPPKFRSIDNRTILCPKQVYRFILSHQFLFIVGPQPPVGTEEVEILRRALSILFGIGPAIRTVRQ